MNMSIKPRYLVIAAAVAAGLYLVGVPAGTLVLLAFGAYMISMHLGGHGGGGGHGGHGGGHGGDSADPRGTSARPAPTAATPPSEHRSH